MGQDHQDEYVAYYRKSVGRAGISRQRTATAAHVEKLGGRIIREYVDTDRTAYQKPGQAAPKREDFDAMLAHLAAIPGLRLAAWHCDRILRNGPDTERVINTCATGDHRVVTVRGGEYDLGTATGRKRIRGDANDAQYEVDHAIERITAQKAEMRAEGRFMGGKRPFGWQLNSDAQGGLVLDDGESRAVADAARYLLSGGSLGAVARQWNADGTLTTTRRRWTGVEVRRVMLRETNWAPPPGKWPPLYDRETHRAVTGLLTAPERKSTPGPEVKFLLSGLIRCGLCWHRLTASTTGAGRGAARTVYRCRRGEGAGHVARGGDALDAYVTEVILAWFEEHKDRFAAAAAESPLAKLEAERELIAQAMKASNDLRRRGLLTDEEFAEERAEHVRKAAGLDQRISAARQVDRLADMAARPREAWAGRTLDQKRAVIRELVEIVVIPQPLGRPKGWRPGQPYLDLSTIIFGWKR